MEWLGIAGAVASLVGVWLAFAQIKRTNDRVAAMRAASDTTRNQLLANQISGALAEVMEVGAALGRADIERDDLHMIELLRRWRRFSSQVTGLLTQYPEPFLEFRNILRSSISRARSTEEALVQQVPEATSELEVTLRTIAEIVDLSNEVVAALRVTLYGTSDILVLR